ncbi:MULTISPECIES: hypothetical protein [unclassified Streptomyces]|uniref:hypothetical protein n=1 Tax=unclassified Streptomyces TaxID=2593676 RepID=UPI00342F83CF
MGGRRDEEQPGRSGKGPEETGTQRKRATGREPAHHRQPGQPAKPARGKRREGEDSTRHREEGFLREEDLHDE